LHEATATPRAKAGVGVTSMGSSGTVTKSRCRTNAVVSTRSFCARAMTVSFDGWFTAAASSASLMTSCGSVLRLGRTCSAVRYMAACVSLRSASARARISAAGMSLSSAKRSFLSNFSLPSRKSPVDRGRRSAASHRW
jgi:hypothetical protein